PLVPPTKHNPKIPASLEAVVARALDRVPDHRFPTMLALGEALLPFASERVALVCSREFASVRGTRSSRTMKASAVGSVTEADEERLAPKRPFWKSAASASIAVCAMIGMVGAFAWSHRHDDATEAAPPPAPVAARTAEPPPAVELVPSPREK